MHPMLIALLFRIAKTQKQPKCSRTVEWVNKMWYIHTIEYYSTTRKNEIMPFVATWMGLEMIIQWETNQTEKDILWYYSYVESKAWQEH